MGRVRETLHDVLRQTDPALLALCAAVLLFMRGAGYSYGGYWFACCNLLVGGSNLLPLPGLDGWRIAGVLHGIGRT